MMRSLMLVDLASLVHPIWHMSQNDPNPDATSIQTVARVRALANGQPYVAVCCDKGPYFRKEIDPSYKATRPDALATLNHQIDLAVETLEHDGYPVWRVRGYEADDLLAAGVMHALKEPDTHVTLVSQDKDVLQLVGPRVVVKSLKDGRIIDETAVIEKYGVRPDQMRDLLALCGDTTDNIIGCKGIGPKRGAQLLQQFDSLEGIYDAKLLPQLVPGVTPSLVTALKDFKPRMPMVRDLVTLRTDAPIPFDEIFRERVAADAHLFGTEADAMMTDLEDAMPTLVDGPQVPLPEDDAPAGPPSGVRPSAANGGDSPKSPAPAGYGEAGRAPTGGTTGGLPSRGDSGGVLHVLPAPVDFTMQLEPRDMREAKQLAVDAFQSRLFSQYGSAAAVLAIVLSGREFGLGAMASLRAFHLIENKPTMSASLIRALVLKSGLAEYFTCTERTAEAATFATKRKGDPREITLTYTIEEAKIAWSKGDEAWKKSGWARNSADMCVARASSKLARLVYSDVLEGVYAVEEFD